MFLRHDQATAIAPAAVRAPAAGARRLLLLAAVCLLLAIAQLLIAGYSFGVGNQTIQVPLLQQTIDGRIYSNDTMIATTAGDYPTYFFRMLAVPARVIPIRQLYFFLHVLTAAGVFAAVFALARAMFDDWMVAATAALLLVAGHHQALAGDSMYSVGFTHTFAVLPLAILAIAQAYRRRFKWAFLIAGLLFNLHALTAGYLLVLLVAAALADRWSIRRLLLPLLLFAAVATPTVLLMLAHRQAFDAQWLALTRIRSADHSFPSTWWQAGSADLPRFALIAALFALSFGFHSDSRVRRKTLAMMIAAGALFVVGYALSDIWAVPVVVRAQLFRASRLVIVLFFLHIAHAIVSALRATRGRTIAAGFAPSPGTPGEGWGDGDFERRTTVDFSNHPHASPLPAYRERGPDLPAWRIAIEILSATITFATLAIPPFLPALPLAVAVAVMVALINGRLSTGQAVAVSGLSFVCVASWHDLGFPLFANLTLVMPAGRTWAGIAALTLAAAALVIFIVQRWPIVRLAAIGSIAIATGALLVSAGARPTPDGWSRAQLWALDHTQTNALFLSPIQPGGFRLQSNRAVVGEWRDGTQLYFSSKFAPIWWNRMSDLQPGLLTDSAGDHLLSRGRSLESLDDDSLIALATKVGATHIVLPRSRERNLKPVYINNEYAIYLPTMKQAEVPADAPDADRWQADDRFMRETVLPNIDKNRKGDVRLQLLDSDGRPLAGTVVDVHQVRQSFDFSASLPFFQEPAGSSTMGDYMPPPVQQPELDAFLKIFNFTMIPFSSKWMYVEPEEGQRHYEELDKYIDFCVKNGIRVEYHFLSGYAPYWLSQKSPQDQAKAFVRHAKQLAERYGNKIEAWQVVNESLMFQQSPAVFAALRKIVPDAKLGIADCAKFSPENRFSNNPAFRERDMYRGLDQIRWLQQQGVKVDFFGFHGHRPFGLWPEASVMYKMFDAYAKEGVRVHVTEVTIPEDNAIIGPIRSGRMTAEAQAEYYTRFFTICYSHPSVDMVNLWGIGPNTWQRGSGLLDDNYKPKPAFDALRKLITETWKTNLKLTLGLDGAATFRGFHGDYEAAVTLPNGVASKIRFSIRPGEEKQDLRMRLNATGTFTSTISPTN